MGSPLRMARHVAWVLRNPRRTWHLLGHWRTIRASDYFDQKWYLRCNPDVMQYRLGPLWHFVLHGHREGRSPSKVFIVQEYLQRNADVREAGANPLVHYLRHGIAEGRPVGPPAPITAADLKELLARRRVNILCTKHVLFVAKLIKRHFEDHGFRAEITESYNAGYAGEPLHVVICPQVFPVLPETYIAFQMEQYTNERWFTPEYFDILQNAVAVLDYSPFNIERMRRAGISLEKLYYLPIGPLPGLDGDFSEHILDDQPEYETIDVLFYGDDDCPRRRRILAELKARFNVTSVCNIYHETMAALIKRAKVVVNLHYYETALLETTRINEVLSLGTAVVSEVGIDQPEHADMARVVDFVACDDVEGLAQKIDRLLSDRDFFDQRMEDIRRHVQTDNRFGKFFNRFMLGMGVMDFREFQRSDDFMPELGPQPFKVCLSMSETPVRTQQFLQAPDYGFRLVEGLRHPVRWVGCGMAFKYYLSKLRQRSDAPIVICEDDVVFPPNFDQTLEKVLRYLAQTERKWHIFSGFIAYIRPEAKVLHVEDREGIRYVYLDTITSGVMNIYSPEAADITCLWNEADPKGQQIDRHLEAWPGLVTVVTLPYLVGHAHDHISSIMDKHNSFYTEMAQGTENQLRRMVMEYMARNGNGAVPRTHLLLQNGE